jgi:hemin uptake protein HemP
MADAPAGDESAEPQPSLPPAPTSADRSGTRILRSDELFEGRREVWIEHGTEMYRLRITSAGKLYLTK